MLQDTSCFADRDLLVGRSVMKYEFKFAMKDRLADVFGFDVSSVIVRSRIAISVTRKTHRAS